MSDLIPVVIYGSKSSPDEHASIPDQLADCRAMAEREGWTKVAEYQEEDESGWSADRGPQLAAAMQHAERLAQEHGRCYLLVQHSDRLARGDAKKARHLVEIVLWGVKVDVTIRTVEDDMFADPRVSLTMGSVMGMRNNEDSERKSKAVRGGLKRRKESGEPVGKIPLGYKPESVLIDGKATTRRVIDPATAPLVERIFNLVEAGRTFGDVASILNSEGIRTRPTKKRPNGSVWINKAISVIVHNTAYKGERGYDAIIPAARFDAIQAGLKRLDPTAVARQKAGRKPKDYSYFLRGMIRCRQCDSTLYARRYAAGRVYVCRHRLLGDGVCSAPVIPAQLIESHVLSHLDTFIDHVEEFLAELVNERDSERQAREVALERDRGRLRDLERKRERHFGKYMKLADDDDPTARIAAEVVDRMDAELADLRRLIEEAEAVVSEWSGPPDLDSALDYYKRLIDHVHDRVPNTEDAQKLNEALSTFVAGLWAGIVDDELMVDFELLDMPIPDDLPADYLEMVRHAWRPSLPERHVDDRTEPKPLRQTENQTFV